MLWSNVSMYCRHVLPDYGQGTNYFRICHRGYSKCWFILYWSSLQYIRCIVSCNAVCSVRRGTCTPFGFLNYRKTKSADVCMSRAISVEITRSWMMRRVRLPLGGAADEGGWGVRGNMFLITNYLIPYTCDKQPHIRDSAAARGTVTTTWRKTGRWDAVIQWASAHIHDAPMKEGPLRTPLRCYGTPCPPRNVYTIWLSELQEDEVYRCVHV
jgi:hypothetical protein